jgi:hypothetical protein
MNTFGIDHQPGVTFVALREGGQQTARVALVGDGARSMIPNTASPQGHWGSSALGQAGAYSPTGTRGAWIDDPGASLFWKGLYTRLSAYLGRMAPIRANGYRLAIALQGDDYSADAHAVTVLTRAAGFDDVVLLPSTYALLCRWLASTGVHEHRPRTVITLAVGEVATLVGGFQLEWSLRGLPTVRAASFPKSVPETGYRTWNRRLIELVCERLKEAPPQGYPKLLQDAALRYAVRLSQAGADKTVPWRETLEEQLYAPLSLSYAQCASWPECLALAQALPDAARAALTTLGSSTADLIVVGGIGAVWPFVERTAAVLGQVWRSSAAGDDVAVGASWCGELCEYASGALITGPVAHENPAEQTPVSVLPEPPRAFRPPWERGAADVD